jgi:hypothetical protein
MAYNEGGIGLTPSTTPGAGIVSNGSAFVNSNPLQSSVIFEDFYGAGTSSGQVGQYGWQVGGSGTITAGAVLDNGHPGVYSITVNSGATPGYIELAPSQGAIIFGGGQIDLYWTINIPTLSISTARYTLAVGFGGDGVIGNDTALLQYSDNVNSGKWQTVTQKAGSGTNTNTTIAVTTGWHTIRVSVNAGITAIAYYVDGVLAATDTTNLTNNKISPLLGIQNNVGATNDIVYADMCYMYQSLTNPR